MTSAFPPAVPEVPVSHLNAALAYYETCLGFDVDWRDEQLGLAGISKGDCRLFLANAEFRQHRRNVGPILIWLNLASKADVDALHRVWAARSATVLSVPESKPWGLHEFTATDPDGNFFRIFYDFATPEREHGR
jgi:uncharacterized glyoxalase superfamily protein PhnB